MYPNEARPAPTQRTMWHSTDEGRTWSKFETHHRTAVGSLDLALHEVYNDGYGNLYAVSDPRTWT